MRRGLHHPAAWFLSSMMAMELWAATGRVPSADSEVVASVRPRGASSLQREVESMRTRLRQSPGDAALAAQCVRRCLEADHREPDPRWLGWAMNAMEPWSKDSNSPTEIRLVRALLLQRRHEFAASLVELDAVVAANPRASEAWLVKSTVHAVRGELELARRAAGHLWQRADLLSATTATATVASLTGGGTRSCELLERVLQGATNAQSDRRLWAWTQLAETRERLGHREKAESAYRRALEVDARDPYALGAFADFLLLQNRHAEAAALIEPFLGVESLLLRWTEARMKLGSADSKVHEAVQRLDAGFALQAARGERVHRREEARFRLHVQGDVATALKLARENWEVQREPADLLLLAEAATAAKSGADLETVRRWMASTGLEDVRHSPQPVAQR